MERIALSLALLIACTALPFLGIGRQLNTREYALGGAGVALQDTNRLGRNPAGLAVVTSAFAGVSYRIAGPAPGISTATISLILPLRKQAVAADLFSYGFSAYREERLGILYARNFGKNFSMGMKINCHWLQILQYGEEFAWTVETGIQYSPIPGWVVGIHLVNPSHNVYTTTGAELPLSMAIGVCWKVDQQVVLVNEAAITPGSVTGGSTGVEYTPGKGFCLRGGLAYYPFSQYIGFGMHYPRFTIDCAAGLHQQLGRSSQISFNYEF